jgi:uncharacterized protein DUF4157
MTAGPVHAEPQPEQQAPRPATAQPALSPVAPVPVVVGHAEDRAEHDADAAADSALARLRRIEGTATHQHGPGCDHSSGLGASVRRSTAPPTGTTVVGREGGTLDAQTGAAIASRKGGGRPLEDGVRRRMESAFSQSFSGVRIHDDEGAARLSSSISASAFTTGKDIFFGRHQYAPGSASGDRVLAHELAHTLQRDSPARRKMSTATTTLDDRTHAAVLRGVAASQTVRRAWPWSKKEQPKPPPPPPGFKGKGGALPSTAAERGKGGIAGTVVGGSMVAGKVGSAAAPMLGGLTGGAAGLLTTGDAMMGLNNADDMMKEAAEFGDAGMWNLAGRKGKNQGIQALTGATQMAKGGVEMAYLAGAGAGNDVVKAMAQGAGNTTLGVAAGGLGIASGSIQVLQGLWRGGKAVQKLARLTWGRGAKIYSKAGERWKAAITGVEKFKLGMAAVKTALGVLGIAAGALLIVSNPIGWGIGIAAAIAGGIAAGVKINAKINDAKARAKISQEILQSGDAERTVQSNTGAQRGALTTKSAGAKKLKERGRSEEEQQRLKAIEHANEVGRRASEYAVIAAEMRDALRNDDSIGRDVYERKQYLVLQILQKLETDPGFDPTRFLKPESNAEKFDAYQLLSSINVTDDEALSDSGQDLIEKKLSKMEAM